MPNETKNYISRNTCEIESWVSMFENFTHDCCESRVQTTTRREIRASIRGLVQRRVESIHV